MKLVVATAPGEPPIERDMTPEELAELAAARLMDAAALGRYAAEARWRRETGGITLPSGVAISTDAVAQTKISAAHAAFRDGTLTETIAFKSKSGWFDADAAAVADVYSAVVRHVQACYAKERDILDAIAGGALTSAEEIDAAFRTI